MEDNHNNMAGRIDLPFLYENNDDYFLLLYTFPQDKAKDYGHSHKFSVHKTSGRKKLPAF